MKQESSMLHLIVVTVFVGILLTCSIFYFTNLLVEGESTVAPSCYDGSVFEKSDPLSAFQRTVYQHDSSLALIREYQYRLFGIVSGNTVIAGEDDFLFPVWDEAHHYSYVDDFTGKSAFTARQSAAILAELERRRTAYEALGAEYLLVVLPNAQTVYSECMPAYYGPISEQTRLRMLNEYLYDHGYIYFVDLTDELREAKSDGLLYNNTESSLNALGFYHVYRAIYQRFSDDVLANTDLIQRKSLHFYQHRTTGKSVAREAGLSDVVYNRTVSLSNSTKLNYRYVYNAGFAATTILLPFYVSSENTASPELLLQFSNTWDRLQIEPYFSNTFGMVTYQTDLEEDPGTFAAAAPKVVIQFIYENELSLLLPEEMQ